MTNSAFHKLCYEFDLNYRHNQPFHDYCEESGIMYTDSIYGCRTATTENMKNARIFWKKNHRFWFKDTDDVDKYIDDMPIGGYDWE